MAFMISKETENVQSSEEIENAFRAITSGERSFVTKEELYAVSLKYSYCGLFVCGAHMMHDAYLRTASYVSCIPMSFKGTNHLQIDTK
jgi:hypothetical protein